MKNNVLFTSGTCSYSDTLPKNVALIITSSTSNIYFECYMTNAICSFTPTDEISISEYKILYTINYSSLAYTTNDNTGNNMTNNLNMVEFNYRINTDQTTTTQTLAIGGSYTNYGNNYSTANFSTQKINSYFNGTGELKTNDFTSNNILNQNSITTNILNSTTLYSTTINSTTINSTSINVPTIGSTTINSAYITASNTITTQSLNSKYSTIDTYFTARNITAAYLIDGSISSRPIMYPIVCSTKNLHPNDTDDSYIVNAGYKIITYYDGNYSGISNTYDNTYKWSNT